MNKNSAVMLALGALWGVGSLYLITYGMSFEQVGADVQGTYSKLVEAVRTIGLSLSETSGWLIALVIIIIPGALGAVLDGRGQSASGWLFLVGLGVSVVGLLIFIPLYFGGAVLAMIWGFLFG